MPEISVRGLEMPESPIRKLAPLAAAANGANLRIGDSGISSPRTEISGISVLLLND